MNQVRMQAANDGPTETDEVTNRLQRLAEAKALVRRHIPPGTSLVDELIRERRKAARQE
jgi:hypothetical protein